MKMKVLLKTSSGLVPFDKTDLPKELKETLKSILKDLFPNEEEFKAEKNKVAKEMTIPYYIWKIAERNKVGYHDVERLLSNLWQVNPGAVIQVLARAIAMEIDMNYPDHISAVDEGYIISPFDGKIHKTIISPKFNFRNNGVFRVLEDAETAYEILKSLIEYTYGRKQEDKGSHKD